MNRFFYLALFIFSVSAVELSAAPSHFQLQDNRIMIQVMINDRGPFHMMLDTGATNILSNEVAQALSLSKEQRFPISGGGENILYGSYCQVQKLEISSEILWDSRFICMDLKEMQTGIGFPHLDGLIGYEVFAKFLTEIDFDKMQIRLKSFSERQALGKAEQVIPLSWYNTTPLVDATVDGVAGRFWLDTGDRASATLALPFIEQHQLMQKYQPPYSMMTGYGLGGPLKTATVVAQEFKIGALDFPQTLMRLPTTKSQALSLPGVAGTLGMGLLRKFNMVLDYSRSEMVLSANQAFVQDRRFDRSGMWISPGEEALFEVRDVLEGGPAWTAGFRAGHFILSVDGVEASQISVLDLREKLKDRQRKQIRFSIRAGIEVKTVTVFLRDLI